MQTKRAPRSRRPGRSLCAPASAAREHVDEPGEALVEVVAAQGDQALGALRLRARDAGLTQQPEVVGARRRRDAERAGELVAGARAAVAEQTDDLEADGVAERAHDR